MHIDLGEKLDSIQTKHLVKFLLALLAITALLIAGAFSLYFNQFHAGFSPDQQDWGNFGGFVGGTLTPALSFLSLLALVLTVALQARQLSVAHEDLLNSKAEYEAMRDVSQQELKQTREAAEEQSRQFREEITKAELVDMIKFVHSELEQRFEAKTDFSPSGKTFGYYFSYSAPSIGLSDIPTNGEPVSENDRVLLADLCELLVEVNGYLAQYEAEFRASARTFFFKKRYMTAANRLIEKRFLLKPMLSAFQSVGYAWTSNVQNPSMEPTNQAAEP